MNTKCTPHLGKNLVSLKNTRKPKDKHKQVKVVTKRSSKAWNWKGHPPTPKATLVLLQPSCLLVLSKLLLQLYTNPFGKDLPQKCDGHKRFQLIFLCKGPRQNIPFNKGFQLLFWEEFTSWKPWTQPCWPRLSAPWLHPCRP